MKSALTPLFLILTAMAGSAAAHEADGSQKAATCTEMDRAFPPAFAAWGKPALPAGTTLSLDQRTRVRIAPAVEEQSVTLTLEVPGSGVYLISASKAVWIDAIQNEETIQSTAHGGKYAPCTSIRKTVEFPLKAGPALVRLSKSTTEEIDLLVARKPD